MGVDDIFTVRLTIPFPSKREAEIAYDVLRIDTEPNRLVLRKFMEIKGHLLMVKLVSNYAKNVRVGLTSFWESLILCCETIEQLGPPLSNQYDHY